MPPPAGLPARYFWLRHKVAHLLRNLGVDAADGHEAIVDALSRRLDAPIHIRLYSFPVPGFFSFVIVDPEHGEFHIFVQAATSHEHQLHLLMHEVAHIILGTLDLGDSIVAGTHRTGDYSNLAERDAEFVARLISTWIDLHAGAQLPVQPDPAAERLSRTLQDRLAW
ncbi:hypothetical protein [Nocardia arthritidis]|uniref:ImmA/IrrE family metallo-endopeptidase n=1 Tax=Nocardia arthritidis TaxID=228602 RepID=A0A6G9YL92_9NOCA|nr:hypothetical protein [Nocardia arthritidis]QIS13951.1 hypothetical protein F5544_30540 [Nocardia arthritidis]